MKLNNQAVHQISRFGTHYSKLNKISFFKNLAKSVLHALNLSTLRIGRKWILEDI